MPRIAISYKPTGRNVWDIDKKIEAAAGCKAVFTMGGAKERTLEFDLITPNLITPKIRAAVPFVQVKYVTPRKTQTESYTYKPKLKAILLVTIEGGDRYTVNVYPNDDVEKEVLRVRNGGLWTKGTPQVKIEASKIERIQVQTPEGDEMRKFV